MTSTTEIEKRASQALSAIKKTLGTEAGEDSVTLFVEHHLQELPETYWQQHVGSRNPEPNQVIALLQLRSSWGERDIEYLDFTLPDDVTNYVVSVHFDATGHIECISMES